MAGSFEKVMQQRIQAICDRSAPPAGVAPSRRALVRHQAAIIRILAKIVGQ